MKMREQFRAARRVGTPLIAIQTADPAAAVDVLNAGTPEDTPVIQYDLIRGWRAVNKSGGRAVSAALDGADAASATQEPTEMLMLAEKLPEKTILFVHNAHRLLRDDNSRASAEVAQALWNLRDLFKDDLRTVVLLGPSFQLPAELSQDVLLLDEPLPTSDQLSEIASTTFEDAGHGDKAKPELLGKVVDALRGLAAFPAEQVTAMAMTTGGIDLDALWERKRQMIEATPGLNVWRGGERFRDVGGCEQVKSFLSRVIGGEEAPRVVVFIDEIEKMLAGATSGAGDSSGVSQDFLGALLSYMQDNEAAGSIFVGPPGAAKSAVAKACGGEAGIPTISLDLGGMKASLVGESEQRLRQALKVVTAVGGGRALFLATCNKIATLPPELRRRFTMGTFFFDLPDDEERAAIWKLYLTKFGLKADQRKQVADQGWTGAEIKQCCLLSYRLGLTLAEASAFIVPVSRSAADDINELRRQASGKFLSASRPGLYEFQQQAQGPAAPARTRGRRIELEG
jgi:hypothetical protein